jgi:hypothetical protein
MKSCMVEDRAEKSVGREKRYLQIRMTIAGSN